MRVLPRPIGAILLAAIVVPLSARSDCTLTSVGVTPLDDAGPRFYKNFQCGPRQGCGLERGRPAVSAARVKAALEVL